MIEVIDSPKNILNTPKRSFNNLIVIRICHSF